MIKAARTGYVHDALYCASEQGLVAEAVPFLREGLDDGEAAVLVTTEGTSRLLLAALDHDPRVRLLAAEDVHAHASRALTAYGRTIRDELAAGAPRVRLVCEAAPDADTDAWLEWMRFEALCNRVLDGLPLWSLCAYDRRRLPAETLVSAGVTHPNLVDRGVRRPNPLYQEPAEVLAAMVDDAPDPLEVTPPELDVSSVTHLQPVRQAVRGACTGRLGRDAVDDFVLAVGEVVANALKHGLPPVRLRLWAAATRVVCTVTDGGPGVDDPFAGYLPQRGEGLMNGGMGLWLARQLCHRLHMWRGPDGFTVRLTAC